MRLWSETNILLVYYEPVQLVDNCWLCATTDANHAHVEGSPLNYVSRPCKVRVSTFWPAVQTAHPSRRTPPAHNSLQACNILI
jgi:hypothetical protein